MKHKIVVKHSRIEINDYELGDCSKIEYIFSIWNPQYYMREIMGMEYDEENKKLILPRGIDIPWLENIFNCNAYVDKYPDDYESNEQIPIKYLAKDQRQVEILKFILGKDNYAYTKSKSQLSCNSTTGSGKTFVTIASICVSGSRAVIITSSIKWLNQWRDRILEYTPLDPKQIYMIVGSQSIDRLMCRDSSEYKIFLASHNTLKSYGDNNGWDKVHDLFNHMKVSMKVFDESHLYFNNMAKIDFHTNTKKTLYLTATPKRSNADEDTIFQLYFKNIPSIVLFDEEQDPHVNYVAMHFNSHPKLMDIKKCCTTNRYGFARSAYTNYVVETENFFKMLCILIDMTLNINGKVLIYIGTNSAIARVKELILSQFPFLRNNVGIYTSVVKDEEKDQQLQKKYILSTTKSCGAASDISGLSVTINLAEPFKSSVLAQQSLGRCRAYDTFYFDIVDTGFKQTKNYYEEKKPIFSRYAKSCNDVIFNDAELDDKYNKVIDKHDSTMCYIV